MLLYQSGKRLSQATALIVPPVVAPTQSVDARLDGTGPSEVGLALLTHPAQVEDLEWDGICFQCGRRSGIRFQTLKR